MKYYGFNLDYENSYQKWSFLITHKAYVKESDGYISIDGVRAEANDETALYFEKLFSRYLKIAYVDLLNAEKSDLDIIRYEVSKPIIIIHKIVWRHLSDKITYLVFNSSSMEPPRHLNRNEAEELLSVFGIPIF